MPTFTPPTLTGSASQTPRVCVDTTGPALRLYSRATPVPSSQSVLKNPDGTYRTVTSPSQDEIAAAAVHYQGGRSYTVTQTEADALTAAGYIVTA